ncbi:MAG: hypothetical protein ACC742_17130, partial [Thermoanaerobaculales bacterium]
VVPSAVKNKGANDTEWQSDFRFFNPCGEDLDVRIEYQPEGVNNTGVELLSRSFQMSADESRVFADIVDAIPALGAEERTGSVRIESESDSGCKVLSVSRTYNETPFGTLGLFVPALPVKAATGDLLEITGLIHNASYRSNVRLVNFGDEDVWVRLKPIHRNGDVINDGRSALVPGHSTRQVNNVASWTGIDGNLAPFTIRIETGGADVEATATIVDNISGDSVLYQSSFLDENVIWVVGAAHNFGVNDSQWRTDLWLFNPTDDWLGGQLEYVVGDSPGDQFGFQWPTMVTLGSRQYLDVVGTLMGGQESAGYMILTGEDGDPAPQIAARTYNLDLTGGTYGLNLRVFGSDDLLAPGETGYIAGISSSATKEDGFRTNLGLLNTDQDGWTGVAVTLYRLDGSVLATKQLNIAPGVLRQFDVFKFLGVAGETMKASIKVEVLSGGGVAAYATEVDNRTQDSIFIPAQKVFMGAAR